MFKHVRVFVCSLAAMFALSTIVPEVGVSSAQAVTTAASAKPAKKTAKATKGAAAKGVKKKAAAKKGAAAKGTKKASIAKKGAAAAPVKKPPGKPKAGYKWVQVPITK